MLTNNFGVQMDVFDAREIPIEVGSFVRYSRTGTISEVIAIEEIDNKNWIKLAKTELLYSPEFLEVLDEKDFDSDAVDFKDREVEVDVEDIKDFRDDFENMELSSNVAEGGG